MRIFWIPIVLLSPSVCAEELKGQVGIGVRAFLESPASHEQSDTAYEMSIEIEVGGERDNFSYGARAYGLWDNEDQRRSRLDLREAYVQWSNERWSARLGVDQVFWGVTESRHLVDIVNQTDIAADILEDVKLGQPMLRLTRQWDGSVLDVFVLPYFRERTFPGPAGRLRPGLVIAQEQPIYESNARERHVDLAARYALHAARWDIGLSTFRGTQREPYLLPTADSHGDFFLRPFYGLITQYGIDLQYTNEAWLWKAELIKRRKEYDAAGARDPYTAFVVGTEYTFFDVSENVDLGVLVEALYDSRGRRANTPFQRDVFFGARLVINDSTNTDIIAGGIIDVENGDTFWRFEANRRLNDHWTVQCKALLFGATSVNSPMADLRDDSYVGVTFTRWF